MKVKEIISIALNYVERSDISDALAAGAELDGEQNAVLKAVLFCYNSVENELARHYFVLENTEMLTSVNGRYAYSAFAFNPTKIIEVSSDGEPCGFSVTPTGLVTDKTVITVRYEYAPSVKEIGGESSFDGLRVDAAMIAAGTAAEYCLINGEISLAELWESRYKERIDRARPAFTGLKIPPRRWV